MMKRAFTLIELITIIVIIAVTAGILVPSFTGYYNHSKFNGVVRDIRDLLAEAHDRAISKDTTTRITFDAGRQLFDLQVTPPLPPTDLPVVYADEGREVSPGERRGYVLREGFEATLRPLTQSAQTQETSKAVTFHSDGSNDGVEVIVASVFGYRAKITVMPTTGQTLVEDL